jgi:hypothetical protein
MDKTYCIIRFFENGERGIIKEGLTLEEAKDHCKSDDTEGEDNGVKFFDGFQEE